MVFLYNTFIFLYKTGIAIAGIWNTKAKQWLAGRKNIWRKLEDKVSKSDRIIWIHTSSAGEFEQAKPLIEALKRIYPLYKILVSFFSPSGFNSSKNYTAADYIIYLPIDTSNNSNRFVKIIDPQLVVFIKYDLWYHYLKTINDQKIPLLLVSSVFRKEQAFFKWYGGFYRRMLAFFNMIFVQDQLSGHQLKTLAVNNWTVSGDTRFDRVTQIAANFSEIPFIKEFIDNTKVLVAGSTWLEDEKLISDGYSFHNGFKLIIAPHEVHRERINQIKKRFGNATLYSQLKEGIVPDNNVLIIDNVGMLSKLYNYATIAYVGGGFTRDGIHNILEAAVFSKPVLFGPNYKKYREASELIKQGGAFSVATASEFKKIIERLLIDEQSYKAACRASFDYINQNKGATQKIIDYIQEKRLLTN